MGLDMDLVGCILREPMPSLRMTMTAEVIIETLLSYQEGSDEEDDGHQEPPEPPGEYAANLGCWRKHPDLHGFIVDTFAYFDNCRPILLDAQQLQQIIDAIQSDSLPHNFGCCFGSSYKPGQSLYEEQKMEDLATFTLALQWLLNGEPEEDGGKRGVYYQADW